MKPEFGVGDVVRVIDVTDCCVDEKVIGAIGTIRWVNKTPYDESFDANAYAIAFPKGTKNIWDCAGHLYPGEEGLFIKFNCVELATDDVELDVGDYI